MEVGLGKEGLMRRENQIGKEGEAWLRCENKQMFKVDDDQLNPNFSNIL
jgi:hypothetical protein